MKTLAVSKFNTHDMSMMGEETVNMMQFIVYMQKKKRLESYE